MFGGTVRGTRTTLRLPEEADLAAHRRWAADPDVRRAGPLGRWHEPAALATWKERWTEQAKDRGSVLWSIEATGELVGFARLRFDGAPRAEVFELSQLVIDPAHVRRGYGADSALALHRWAFDLMHLRLAVVPGVAADDAGRRRILEQLGYRRFGHGHAVYYRDGAYVDQYLYQLESDDWHARWPSEREYPPLADDLAR